MNKSGGLNWVVGIIVFFLTVILFKLFVLYLALESSPGLIEDRPYERGLAYDETVERLRNVYQTGARLEITFGTVEFDGSRAIRAQFFDGNSSPLKMDKVTFIAKRPDAQAEDIEGLLIVDGEGYVGSLSLPLPGLWMIWVKGIKDQKQYLWKLREVL